MQNDSLKALETLEKILTHEIKAPSSLEASLLIEHKEACCRKLLPMLAYEITEMQEDRSWEPYKLFQMLKLLGAFREPRAFDWIVQLKSHKEVFDEGEHDAISMVWGDIIEATAPEDWNYLKSYIESVDSCSDFKEGCVNALISRVCQGKLNRSDLVDYFDELYSHNLSGETYDPELLVILADASTALWPGESLEEIREVFGLGLIPHRMMSFSEVQDAYDLGQKTCMENLEACPHPLTLEEYFSEDLNPEEEEDESEPSDEELDEIEIEQETLESDDEEIQDPLYCEEIETLSESDQALYRSLPKLLLESPEEALEVASQLVASYPLIPAILYYFHSALIHLNAQVLAMTVLREWRDKFPEDLLAKIEFGNYFLRRHEPEKVKELFNNTWSLIDLCPERNTFDEIECVKFFHLAGCYFLQIGDIQKAEEQIHNLDVTCPYSYEYFDLKLEYEITKENKALN